MRSIRNWQRGILYGEAVAIMALLTALGFGRLAERAFAGDGQTAKYTSECVAEVAPRVYAAFIRQDAVWNSYYDAIQFCVRQHQDAGWDYNQAVIECDRSERQVNLAQNAVTYAAVLCEQTTAVGYYGISAPDFPLPPPSLPKAYKRIGDDCY